MNLAGTNQHVPSAGSGAAAYGLAGVLLKQGLKVLGMVTLERT